MPIFCAVSWVSVPPFNLTIPATASTIATMLLPPETVDVLGMRVKTIS